MAYDDLACSDFEVLLSAVLDGEVDDHEQQALTAHLADCPDCAALAGRFAVLDRSVRVRPAEAVPDLTGPIVEQSRRMALGRGQWLRPALAWVALVLAAQNVVPLIGGELAGADPHLARHVGAFGVALAIGFGYVAWKPHRAHGLLPFATALIATLVVSGVLAVIDGGRSMSDESAHISEVAGLFLLWMIAGSPGWQTLADLRIRRPQLRHR